MENLKLQTLPVPHATGKPATSDATTHGTATDTQKDFQALLQRLMGLEIVADTPAATALENSARTADRKDCDATDEEALNTPLITPAETPVIATALPLAAPPALSETLHANANGHEWLENTKAIVALSAKQSGEAKDGVASGTSEPVINTDSTAEVMEAAAPLPKLPGHSAGPHLPHEATTNPQHALEALAEHRDAAVSNLPVPQFTQGPHLTHPAHPSHPTHPLSGALATIDTPISAPEWNAAFSQKIVWMASEKQHAAELHVNPPELGPVSIRLSIEEHQTNAVFTSPHSEVREAIESALPRLREVLAESGITLGNASVTSDSPRDGSPFAQQRNPAAHISRESITDTAIELDATGTGPRKHGIGLIDLFA